MDKKSDTKTLGNYLKEQWEQDKKTSEMQANKEKLLKKGIVVRCKVLLSDFTFGSFGVVGGIRLVVEEDGTKKRMAIYAPSGTDLFYDVETLVPDDKVDVLIRYDGSNHRKYKKITRIC